MTVYEMRTYTLHVGKMGEAVKLYSELGYPALVKGGQDKKLVGYFQADSGSNRGKTGGNRAIISCADSVGGILRSGCRHPHPCPP